MTEAEWLAAADPGPMLRWAIKSILRGERKARLLVCACARAAESPQTPEAAREAVRAAERFADGAAPRAEMVAARRAASAAGVVGAAEAATLRDPAFPFRHTRHHPFPRDVGPESLCGLLRCLFHPAPVIAPAVLSWNAGTVPRLAAAIYDERAFGRLPVLADALEDAGCTDAVILAHCRPGGEHVRGCWVVDLVLGKG